MTFPTGDLFVTTDDNKKAQRDANYVKTDAGIWVPMSGDDDGRLRTSSQLTGSNVALNKTILPRSGTAVNRSSGGFIDSIGANTSIIIKDTNKATKVDKIGIGINSVDVSVNLFAYNEFGDLRYIAPLGAEADGANPYFSTITFNPSIVYAKTNNEDTLWKILKRDNNALAFELKDTMTFLHGYRLEIVNSSDESVVVRCQQLIIEQELI